MQAHFFSTNNGYPSLSISPKFFPVEEFFKSEYSEESATRVRNSILDAMTRQTTVVLHQEYGWIVCDGGSGIATVSVYDYGDNLRSCTVALLELYELADKWVAHVLSRPRTCTGE